MKKDSRFYTRTGEPCNEVPNKSKGGMRPTKITDAKKLGLYPSVTTILSVLAKPQLEDWKQEQLTAAAYDLLSAFMKKGDDLLEGALWLAEIHQAGPDAFHARLSESAFEEVEDAADAGKAIHRAAEHALKGEPWSPDELVYLPALNESFPMSTFIVPMQAFFREHDIQPLGHEVRLVNHAHGYAGTGDLPMSCKRLERLHWGFGDFKTRKTTPGKPVEAYPEQVMQIAAYHAAYFEEPREEEAITGFNLFLSTTEPGRVEAVWYTPKELAEAYQAFTHVCGIWRFLNSYDPRAHNHPK